MSAVKCIELGCPCIQASSDTLDGSMFCKCNHKVEEHQTPNIFNIDDWSEQDVKIWFGLFLPLKTWTKDGGVIDRQHIDGPTLMCTTMGCLKYLGLSLDESQNVLKLIAFFKLARTVKSNKNYEKSIMHLMHGVYDINDMKKEFETMDRQSQKEVLVNMLSFYLAFESYRRYLQVCLDDNTKVKVTQKKRQLHKKQASWSLMRKTVNDYKIIDSSATTIITFVSENFSCNLDAFVESEKPQPLGIPTIIAINTKLDGFEVEWTAVKKNGWSNMNESLDIIYRVEVNQVVDVLDENSWRSVGQINRTKILLTFSLVKLGVSYQVRVRAQNVYFIGSFSETITFTTPGFMLTGNDSLSNTNATLEYREEDCESIILANASLGFGTYQWDIYYRTNGSISISVGVACSYRSGQKGIVGSMKGTWGFHINENGSCRYVDGVCKDFQRQMPALNNNMILRIIYNSNIGALSYMTIESGQKPKKCSRRIIGIRAIVYPAFSSACNYDNFSICNFVCHARQRHPEM